MAERHGLTHKTIHGFKWSYLSIMLQAVLQLLFLAAMARLLTPKDFGVVGLGAMFTSFVERVGYLGIGPALVQRRHLGRDEPRIAMTLSIILGLVLTLCFFTAAPLMARFFKARALLPVMHAFSVCFLLEGFCSISESLLQRELRFKALLVVHNVSAFAGNVAGIGCALYGCGLWSLVYAALAARCVRLLILMSLKPISPAFRCFGTQARELVIAGFGFSAARLLNYLAVTADNFIVGRRLGPGALGLYGRAYQLMAVPTIYFGQVLEKVLFPAMSQRQAAPTRLRKVFLLGIESAALVGLPAGVMIFCTAREIILVLFGAKWLDVVPTLQILALSTFFRLCYKNSDTLIRSLGAVYRLAGRQLLYLGLVSVGAFFGCEAGLPGVGLAVSCAIAIHYGIISHTACSMLAISPRRFLQAHLPGLWVALWIGACCYPLVAELRAVDTPPIVMLAVSYGVAALTACTALVFLPIQFHPKLFPWIRRSFALERYGAAGRVVIRLTGGDQYETPAAAV